MNYTRRFYDKYMNESELTDSNYYFRIILIFDMTMVKSQSFVEKMKYLSRVRGKYDRNADYQGPRFEALHSRGLIALAKFSVIHFVPTSQSDSDWLL